MLLLWYYGPDQIQNISSQIRLLLYHGKEEIHSEIELIIY